MTVLALTGLVLSDGNALFSLLFLVWFIFALMDGRKAVSYTHLDVYKRQPQDVISYSVLRCVFRVGADNGWLRHGRNVRMLPVISLLKMCIRDRAHTEICT